MSERGYARLATVEQEIREQQEQAPAIEALRQSQEIETLTKVEALNDQAHIAIYGTEGKTVGFIEPDTGNPLSQPVQGKINEILHDTTLYPQGVNRYAKSKAYLRDIDELRDEGFELCQAKLIMDRREIRQTRVDEVAAELITQKKLSALRAEVRAEKIVREKESYNGRILVKDTLTQQLLADKPAIRKKGVDAALIETNESEIDTRFKEFVRSKSIFNQADLDAYLGVSAAEPKVSPETVQNQAESKSSISGTDAELSEPTIQEPAQTPDYEARTKSEQDNDSNNPETIIEPSLVAYEVGSDKVRLCEEYNIATHTGKVLNWEESPNTSKLGRLISISTDDGEELILSGRTLYNRTLMTREGQEERAGHLPPIELGKPWIIDQDAWWEYAPIIGVKISDGIVGRGNERVDDYELRSGDPFEDVITDLNVIDANHNNNSTPDTPVLGEDHTQKDEKSNNQDPTGHSTNSTIPPTVVEKIGNETEKRRPLNRLKSKLAKLSIAVMTFDSKEFFAADGDKSKRARRIGGTALGLVAAAAGATIAGELLAQVLGGSGKAVTSQLASGAGRSGHHVQSAVQSGAFVPNASRSNAAPHAVHHLRGVHTNTTGQPLGHNKAPSTAPVTSNKEPGFNATVTRSSLHPNILGHSSHQVAQHVGESAHKASIASGQSNGHIQEASMHLPEANVLNDQHNSVYSTVAHNLPHSGYQASAENVNRVTDWVVRHQGFNGINDPRLLQLPQGYMVHMPPHHILMELLNSTD